MNTRRFVLHLLVGLLTFLIGLTAAIALGGFDPLERFIRHGSSNRQMTIPPQPLITPCTSGEYYSDYHYHYARPRTADLRYHGKSLTPPPPTTIGPFDEESEAITPSTSSSGR